jgi:hypothetical protein
MNPCGSSSLNTEHASINPEAILQRRFGRIATPGRASAPVYDCWGLMSRVKDVDLERRQIHACDPKGRRDRHTMLPQVAVPLLRHQLELSCRPRRRSAGGVRRGLDPQAIERKIPTAARASGRQWIFPASSRWTARPDIRTIQELRPR